MDFDLHCGNHDLKTDVSRALEREYEAYCEANSFRPTTYTAFTRLVVSLQVRREDAMAWFEKVVSRIIDVENLVRLRVFDWQPSGKLYRLSPEILRVVDKTDDGEVVECNGPVFTQFITDLTFDYQILMCMSPRDFERAMAAVYAKTGCFDRVILTPPSGDEGRDIVLESKAWHGRRMIVELKRYRNRRVSAKEVDSLLGVLAWREPSGSKAAFLTTSRFAPLIRRHRSIQNAIDARALELIDLVRLVEGCIQAEYCDDPLHFNGRSMGDMVSPE